MGWERNNKFSYFWVYFFTTVPKKKKNLNLKNANTLW